MFESIKISESICIIENLTNVIFSDKPTDEFSGKYWLKSYVD